MGAQSTVAEARPQAFWLGRLVRAPGAACPLIPNNELVRLKTRNVY